MPHLTRLITLIAALSLGACASIPAPLQGEYPLSMPNTTSASQTGATVRWGGVLIATNPEPDRTCFEILGKTLENSARPIEAEESQGRFIACKSGFQDPELFKSGRDVTVIGRFEQLEPRMIGEYEYHYPIVNAQTIYLWPERTDYANRAYPYYPYFWGYPHPFFGRSFFGSGLHGRFFFRPRFW